jgi:hypothetical protein
MQTASFQKQKELRKIYTQEKTHHNNTEIIQQIPKHPKAETTRTTGWKFQTRKFQTLLLTHTCTRAPTAETQDFQKQIDLPSYINILLHTHKGSNSRNAGFPKADRSPVLYIQTSKSRYLRVSRCHTNIQQTNTSGLPAVQVSAKHATNKHLRCPGVQQTYNKQTQVSAKQTPGTTNKRLRSR